jgi:ABC-2 type transport system permease protein
MTAAPGYAALPSTASIGRARAALELKLFFRDRRLVLFSFLYPILMMVIFGSVFRNHTVPGGVSYAQYFVAGIAATGIVLSTFQALGIRISVERDTGELARLQALGTPPLAYFTGKAAQVLTTVTLQLTGLLAVARAGYGVALPATTERWVLFAGMVVLGVLAGTVLGVAVSLLPRQGKSADVVIAPIALVLQFFSGVFFIYSQMPSWMQRVAALFPLKWLAQGMRSVFLPASAEHAEVAGGWEHGRTALVLVAWIVVGTVACARWFRWQWIE